VPQGKLFQVFQLLWQMAVNQQEQYRPLEKYLIRSPLLSSGRYGNCATDVFNGLPAIFTVYKVDGAGVYTPIPENIGANGFWHKVSNNSIEVTLLDGGAFDLDGVADGSILDPIVILFNNVNAIPTLSVWGLLFMFALLSLVGRKRKGGFKA